MPRKHTSLRAGLACLLTALLALFAMSAAAEDALPAVGDTLSGFCVTQILHSEQYGLDCVHMEHEKTGAQLIYIPCEDTERSFTVSFRTPAENDKGIPHVYEHSTLGGSEKYPDPSLFFSMIDQTYNTYLNASTYISNTAFESASLSEEQLLAFADYTMAGLYHPLIMTDERAMMREAYRYELAEEDAPLVLTGTVYSEMKAHTSPLEISQVRAMKLLLPGSRFAAYNGGDPDHIPEMTWEELRSFHDRYYHPSNSLTILYGKLDPVPFLELIDGEISAYDRQEIVLTDDSYVPLTGHVQEKSTIPASADAAKETYICYGIPLDSLTDRELDVLTMYGSMYAVDGSPLYNLFAAQMPHVTLSVGLQTAAPVPVMLFFAFGAAEEEAEQVGALLREGLSQTADQGVSGEMMRAAASSFRLSQIQARESNNKGISISLNFAYAWGLTGDVTAWTEDDRRYAQLEELADAETMRSIAEKYLVNPETSAWGVYVTAPGELEEKLAAEDARLAQMKADMTEAEREALIARTQDFAAWTEQNAASTMIDAVKVVDARTLPEEIVRYEAEDTVTDGVRVIRADVDSDELVSVQLVFTADHVPYAQYDVFDTYIELLGSVNTENYTTDALQTAALALSTGISIQRSTIDVENAGFVPVVTVSWDCLPENIDACYELVREMIWRTDETDVEHARLLLATNNQMTAMYFAMDPSMILSTTLTGYLSDAKRFDALASMGDRFRWYMDRSNWSDGELAAVLRDGKAMLLDAMRRENLTVCAIGSAENNDRVIEAGLRFAEALSDELGAHIDYAAQMEALPESIAFPMDIDVGYNAVVMPYGDTGYAMSGKLDVFCSLVSNKVLVPELRFKNACYGAVMQAGRTGVLLYSYRDPKLAESYELYDSLGDRVRALELTQEDVDGFIVSAFSWLSMPQGPMTGGKQAVSDALCGRDSFDLKLRYMREAKQMTPEDVTELAALLDVMAEQGAKVSVNSQKLVAENSDLFAVTDDCFMFSGSMPEGDEAEEASGEMDEAA